MCKTKIYFNITLCLYYKETIKMVINRWISEAYWKIRFYVPQLFLDLSINFFFVLHMLFYFITNILVAFALFKQKITLKYSNYVV